MKELKLPENEYKFLELIWDNEPLGSGELVTLCQDKFNWKKSTTYTVLRRLCEKDILQNEHTIVTAKIKKEKYEAVQTEQFVEHTFQGSLPRFLAAFMSRKKLTKKQIDEIQQIIDNYKE